MRISIIFILIFVSISCSRSQRAEYREENKLLLEIDSNFKIQHTKGRKVYLLIPLNGCSACIDSVINFTKQNFQNSNIIFIISDYGTKPIEIAFENQVPKSNNIIPDPEGYLFELEAVFNNPVTFFVENGKVQSRIVFSSQNSEEIFNQITSFLL